MIMGWIVSMSYTEISGAADKFFSETVGTIVCDCGAVLPLLGILRLF
jgi:hypothetical protein